MLHNNESDDGSNPVEDVGKNSANLIHARQLNYRIAGSTQGSLLPLLSHPKMALKMLHPRAEVLFSGLQQSRCQMFPTTS